MLKADYSLIDTNAATISYVLRGSPSYAGYIDNVAADTTNAQLGIYTRNALRVRNPSDSMELRINIPSTGYQTPVVRYALESSSTTSGQLTELFDYSVDGGTTWRTSQLTVNGFAIDTLDVTQAQYQGTSWGLVQIGFGNDQDVNNNPKLVLRIRFNGNTSKTSGNNRFENITMTGVPGSAPSTLKMLHYWHFNGLTEKPLNSLLAAVNADYSLPGLYRGSMIYKIAKDTVRTRSFGNASGDTTNGRLLQGGGLALVANNPNDSTEIRFSIPTTNYRRLVLKFSQHCTSPSSFRETFDFSVDGGKTWRTDSVRINGVRNDTVNSTQFTNANWGLVTITFGGDTAVNNNSGFVFRIRYGGIGSTLGNVSMLDNVSVDGALMPGIITVSAPRATDTFIAGARALLAYTTVGPVTDSRAIDFSTNNGTSWSTIATGETPLNYYWTVPSVATSNALLRVRDANGVVGMSPAFTIILPGTVSSITLSSMSVLAGKIDTIGWSASGYLGETVDLDVSYDNKASWIPISHGLPVAMTSYVWTTPMLAKTGAVVRVRYASGATGYSTPFNIVVPSNGVISETPTEPTVILWPNPTSNIAYLRYQLTAAAGAQLHIYDVTGREVYHNEIEGQQAGEHTLEINTLVLPQGNYFFVLDAGVTHYPGHLTVTR